MLILFVLLRESIPLRQCVSHTHHKSLKPTGNGITAHGGKKNTQKPTNRGVRTNTAASVRAEREPEEQADELEGGRET